MTKRERLMWDFLYRRKSSLAIARKYRVTKRQAEELIRAGFARIERTGYP